MKLLDYFFPKKCLSCDQWIEYPFFCEECRPLFYFDSVRSGIEWHSLHRHFIEKFKANPIVCHELLVNWFLIALDQKCRFQFDAIVVDFNGPLKDIALTLGKKIGVKVYSLKKGYIRYLFKGTREKIDEKHVLIELGIEEDGLNLFYIPRKILHLPLFFQS